MSIAITIFVLSLVAICFGTVVSSVSSALDFPSKAAGVIESATGFVVLAGVAGATVSIFAEIVVQILSV